MEVDVTSQADPSFCFLSSNKLDICIHCMQVK